MPESAPEAPDADARLPPSQISHHGSRLHYTLFPCTSRTNLQEYFIRGGQRLASLSLLSVGVSHAPVRVPAPPNRPLNAHARPVGDQPFRLAGASAFFLVVTPRPRPLPEVARRELGAGLRAVPDGLWEASPGGRTQRGESVPS